MMVSAPILMAFENTEPVSKGWVEVREDYFDRMPGEEIEKQLGQLLGERPGYEFTGKKPSTDRRRSFSP